VISDRPRDLVRFYSLLDRLEEIVGGARRLADCSGRSVWPRRGVYFFREDGETRRDSGLGPRIVRVGTHALKIDSATSLWGRLSQHKGQTKSGGGNHRGSIFRNIVGQAVIARDGPTFPTWGKGVTAKHDIRELELPLEREVSGFIGLMPFIWLQIEDEANPDSLRGYIERNSIALLSNYEKLPLDPPSPIWLGLFSNRERVRNSGLWNSNHVDEPYELSFLDTLGDLISAMSLRT
jgi:hypothetical protein